MTHTVIMAHKIWFRLITDITIVLSYILFTILIVNTELKNLRTIINVTFLYCWYLVMKKKINNNYDIQIKFITKML